MAKLKAPLMSLGASGALGKALVFFGWKGLNVVREYVVPANPDTQLQQDHRKILKAGVAKVHVAQARELNPLDRDDQIAYAALAAAKGKIMTWFNQALKLWIDVKVAGDLPVIYSNGCMMKTTATDFRPLIHQNEETLEDLKAGKFYLGISKTNLITSKEAVVGLGQHCTLLVDGGFSSLTVGKKYYWQFRPDSTDDCVGADSGIYHAKATA
ncbi:unnamed protein product [marine sediment metagenome]|uniref:Uncharacterized protein n=1 Tax=marine sediment metagenome TaxID=412755 RepID=X1Q7F5_9ZZZZ